jgi:hypothetical protein
VTWGGEHVDANLVVGVRVLAGADLVRHPRPAALAHVEHLEAEALDLLR